MEKKGIWWLVVFLFKLLIAIFIVFFTIVFVLNTIYIFVKKREKKKCTDS